MRTIQLVRFGSLARPKPPYIHRRNLQPGTANVADVWDCPDLGLKIAERPVVQPRRVEWHHHKRPEASRDDCRIAIRPFMAEQANTVARFVGDISSNFATVAKVLPNL